MRTKGLSSQRERANIVDERDFRETSGSGDDINDCESWSKVEKIQGSTVVNNSNGNKLLNNYMYDRTSTAFEGEDE